MPSAAVRRFYEDQIPSFMSVFDLDSDAMDQQGAVTIVDPKVAMGLEPPKLPGSTQPQLGPPTLPTDSTHKHNDSTSTRATESAESSPTTTVSCTDSSDLSDPSPSSSPDSPVNLMPLQTFAPTPFGGLSGMASLSVSDTPNLERPMTSPAPRRPKNMKGLSIQPPFNSLSSSLTSEPASPSVSFIKPTIPAMKRKPSQLSLKTNSSDLMNRPVVEAPLSPSVPTLQVPPILQRRALKHSTSSPHMLGALKSSTFGPPGGMTIPTVLERNESGLSSFLRPPRPSGNAPGVETTIAEEDSPIRAQVANRSTFDVEPYHEVENNEDQKSPGYPDGPICIYPDQVFLYLEPTAEEASKFDLVINVAREVQNPFKAAWPKKEPTEQKPADDSPIPDTAVSAASFATAFEYPDESMAETPTTPKAQPFREPEYVHMPWDHNTDIADDLMTLCELIDKKVKDGKKVLVHCQQGASRSASLIIAYGMYQNPALSVNDAYHAAQARSRWISPNMRLMYCLQDFQKNVSKRKLPSAGVKAWSGRSPTKSHRVTLSADNIERVPSAPLTAPLPAEDTKDASPERSPIRARGNSTPNREEPISPGPSSAPSSFSWAEREDEDDRGRFGRFGPDVMLKPPQPDSGFASISSFSKPPPSPGFAPLSLGRPPRSPAPMKLTFDDVPMSPGFAPPAQQFFKPPPSPGFGAHRFGGSPQGFGFVPLTFNQPPPRQVEKPVERKVEPIPERHVATITPDFSDDTALMSPRAETMTNNPFRGPIQPNFVGMQFIESPPTPTEGLFSPRESMCPRDPFYPFGRPSQVADPRSPPTVGETPIVRSIDEMI